MQTAIIKVMNANLDEGRGIDPTTGLADLTTMAEEAAFDLDHPEWLDDETHIVWDLAIKVAEKRRLTEN